MTKNHVHTNARAARLFARRRVGTLVLNSAAVGLLHRAGHATTILGLSQLQIDADKPRGVRGAPLSVLTQENQ